MTNQTKQARIRGALLAVVLAGVGAGGSLAGDRQGATGAGAEAGLRLEGRVQLVAGRGQKVSPLEVTEVVVYLLPSEGSARPRPGRYSVDTHSKGFRPVLTVVPAGSTVAFPNRDEILHNVFSATPGAAFDLGLYGPGQVRERRFDTPGLINIGCNVHRNMRAQVLVLATPYHARPAPDGRFVLDGLPSAGGTLVAWHPRAAAISRVIAAAPAEPLSLRLVAVRPPLAPPTVAIGR